MSTWAIWTTIIVIGLGTFLLRFSGLQLLGGRSLPDGVMRVLRYVPAAVIAAIVVPAIVQGGPTPGFSPENTRLIAGVVAAGVAWGTRSVLGTLGAGMGTLWLLEWLLGS